MKYDNCTPDVKALMKDIEHTEKKIPQKFEKNSAQLGELQKEINQLRKAAYLLMSRMQSDCPHLIEWLALHMVKAEIKCRKCEATWSLAEDEETGEWELQK